jgi:hypothetical protein
LPASAEVNVAPKPLPDEGKVVVVKQDNAPILQPEKTEPVKKSEPERTVIVEKPVESERPPLVETAPVKIKPHSANKPATPETRRNEPASPKILPTVPLASEPVANAAPASQTADIQYRIQLAASPALIDVSAGKWSKIEYLVEIVEENKLYKYQVRNFATPEEAEQARKKLRATGFNDAFVVAYQNGVRVDPSKIKK